MIIISKTYIRITCFYKYVFHLTIKTSNANNLVNYLLMQTNLRKFNIYENKNQCFIIFQNENNNK